MEFKRVTIICGHYGSGKTNIAVNMAYELKKQKENATIADLDIVNPYFRTLDSEEDFKKRGIRLICSPFANSNIDAPALPQEMYSITDDRRQNVIIDVGGDDRGALALGRISGAIVQEDDYDMYMVINCYRPLTKTVDELLEVRDEIEMAGRIRFTGIINNSNLGRETTREDVLASLAYAEEASAKMKLNIVATSYDKRLDEELKNRVPHPFAMELQKMIPGI
ncbi:MAG: hypothetical protein Q4E54_07000 [Lachnospiraceae bacterium]|nr:hypothetical protein [Lachnospiraceae bacterium]